MFEVISTGENEFYGKKGEKIVLSDRFTLIALKEGWITDNFKWVRYQKEDVRRIVHKQVLQPYKLVSIGSILKTQENRLNSLIKKVQSTHKVFGELKQLLKDLDAHECKEDINGVCYYCYKDMIKEDSSQNKNE